MSTLDLSPDEVSLLREILVECLSDLRAEIADTDSSSFKSKLRDRKDLLNGIIEKVAGAE